MKIQVTFEKETKRQFRDQCIKRLQNFVNQIKEYKQNVDSKRITKPDQVCSKEKVMDKAKIKQTVDKQQEKFLKTVSKFNSFAKKNDQQLICTFIKTTEEPSQSKRESKIVYAEQPENESNNLTNRFNIGQIKDKVNQILQKFQTNQKTQSKHHQTLQSKLQLTNKKLDYLISTIQTTNITAPSSVFSIQNQKQELNSFENRFNTLANKYDQIKKRSIFSPSTSHKSTSYRSNSSLFSPKQSVTFRRL